MPEQEIRIQVDRHIRDDGTIDEWGLEQILADLGPTWLGRARDSRSSNSIRTQTAERSAGQVFAHGYSFGTRLRRKIRWLAMKVVGAAGSAIPFAAAGLVLAILVGMIRAIPADSVYYNQTRIYIGDGYLAVLIFETILF